ncbi:MAG: hypothetical protein EZS28_013617 [Streblomastix strix]|uniref:Uncharacterized protein n=1 Tax=Streblomastix strix TaxID=222440 RepID=A0A5J4W7M1_9EUKA|nr:MAG: hypothetical protein EZS28_013617 [Streblomastix strix]
MVKQSSYIKKDPKQISNIQLRQQLIPRLTSRNSRTDQRKQEEGQKSQNFENRDPTMKMNKQKTGMGRLTARHPEQQETINLQEFIQLGFILQWKDKHSINYLQHQLRIIRFRGTNEEAKAYKTILEEELKENIVIPIKKDQIKLYNPKFMIMKANGKWRKILDAKTLNKQIVYFHFKMHDANEVKQII